MKKIIISLIASVLVGSVVLAYFLHRIPETPAAELFLSVDKTDKLAALPNADAIFSELHIQDNKWQEYKIVFSTLSDMDYNTSHKIVLPSENILLSNPGKRDSAIIHFKGAVTTELQATNTERVGRLTSSIYLPMIKELNRLANSKAKRKIAFFYTNAYQNTEWFSIYRNKDRELLKTNSAEIRRRFEHIAKPADLHGIEVYLIFNPQTAFENESFTLMANLIKLILENAGAKVGIGANESSAME